MVITDITETMQDLTPSQQHKLGLGCEITYAMLWHAFDKIAELLEHGGLINPDSGTRLSVEQFADRLLASSTPDNYHLSPVIALDGTDLETWARRRSWASKKSPVQGRHRDPGRHRRQSRQADERTQLAPRRRGRTPAELARLTGPRRIPVRAQRSRRRRLRGIRTPPGHPNPRRRRPARPAPDHRPHPHTRRLTSWARRRPHHRRADLHRIRDHRSVRRPRLLVLPGRHFRASHVGAQHRGVERPAPCSTRTATRAHPRHGLDRRDVVRRSAPAIHA